MYYQTCTELILHIFIHKSVMVYFSGVHLYQ